MVTEPVLKTVECNSLGGSTPPPSVVSNKTMEEETVELELDDDTYYMASQLAEMRGLTVENIIKEAITNFLEKLKTDYDQIPERY